MIYRFRIFNLRNRSFTPVELLFKGSRFYSYYVCIKIAIATYKVYGKLGKLKVDEHTASAYEYVVMLDNEPLYKVCVDEDEDYSIFSTNAGAA